VHLANSYA